MPVRSVSRWAMPALLTVAGLGLGMSIVLLWEYLAPGSAGMCGDGGGCDAVRASAFASILGIPTPVLGIVYFSAVGLVAAFWRQKLVALTVIGAIVAVALLLVQALAVGAFCKLCVIVDVAALALPVLAWLGLGAAPLSSRGLSTALVAAAVVAAAPLFVAASMRPEAAVAGGEMVAELPPVVAAEQKPGVVTIVEFIDFQCPYCRKFHAQLKDILPDYGDRVRVVRINAPLPFHEFAEYAARAGICAKEYGKGEAMANALFTAERLAPPAAIELSERLGIDPRFMESCIPAEKTTEALKAEMTAAREAGVHGLPTFYIGHQKFVGLKSPEEVRAAIDRALE